jgi:hypothetical protein
MNTMLASDLPLPRIGRGKVRDIYAVGEDRVLLLTTDRISAFDVVMAETIPMKGAVLTQISAWWFSQLEGVVPHHMISADADTIIKEVPALKDYRASAAISRARPGRNMPRQARWPAKNLHRACLKAANSSLRSSARRPRLRPAMTKTSPSAGCAKFSARMSPSDWKA